MSKDKAIFKFKLLYLSFCQENYFKSIYFMTKIQQLLLVYIIELWKIIALIRNISRWKRRFGNRAELENSPSDEILPELEEETSALGRNGAGAYLLNNKIYPGAGNQELIKDKAEAAQQKQVEIQKIICILLCTVFPLLTTIATVIRLWNSGVFISQNSGI